MSARRPAAEPDIGRLLGITGPGGRLIAGLFAVTYTTLAVWAGPSTLVGPENKIALVALLGSAVLLVAPGRFPLPPASVGLVLAAVAFATAATVWRLDPVGWPGWSAWQFAAISFLMFGLALRGRVLAGLLGVVLMALIAMHWSWSVSGDWFHGFDLVSRQLASYGAGAFFAVWLRRTARRIVAYQEAQARRLAEEEALVAAAEARAAELERVRAAAGAALAAIARGEVGDADRAEHALLEAELRDGIRGRALATGPVPAAARAARERGVSVAILDDLREEAPGEELLAAASAWAAERLASATAGEATLRLARRDGVLVVTFAATGRPPEVFAPQAGSAVP